MEVPPSTTEIANQVRSQKTMNTNILSFDVEDWFHILDIDSAPPMAKWDSHPSRIETNFLNILDWLDEQNVKSTCFFLGWVGKQFPRLVREASKRGHEIASHGTAHELVYTLDAEAFLKDVVDAKAVLENCSGRQVLGYRAPGFSVTEDTPWFFEVLARAGYRYDSSIFPAARSHGGMAQARLAPYRVNTEFGDVLEFPISVAKMLGRRVCFSGGGYFRLFPYWLIAKGIRRCNQHDLPAIVYLHPRDFDADQPRLPMPMHRRFKSYINLNKTEAKLKRALRDFSFTSFEEYMDHFSTRASSLESNETIVSDRLHGYAIANFTEDEGALPESVTKKAA